MAITLSVLNGFCWKFTSLSSSERVLKIHYELTKWSKWVWNLYFSGTQCIELKTVCCHMMPLLLHTPDIHCKCFPYSTAMASKKVQWTNWWMKVSVTPILAVERYCLIVLRMKKNYCKILSIFTWNFWTKNLYINVKLCLHSHLSQSVQWNLWIHSLDGSTCFTSWENWLTSIWISCHLICLWWCWLPPMNFMEIL